MRSLRSLVWHMDEYAIFVFMLIIIISKTYWLQGCYCEINTGTYHSQSCKYIRDVSVNPFTANPVKALHFAILVFNPPFFIFDILALSTECQSASMSKNKNGGLDHHWSLIDIGWLHISICCIIEMEQSARIHSGSSLITFRREMKTFCYRLATEFTELSVLLS